VPRIILHFPSNATHSQRVRAAVEVAAQQLVDIFAEEAEAGVHTPGGLLRWEQDTQARVARESVDLVTGAVIEDALEDPFVEARAEALLSQLPDHRLQKSRQRVPLDLLGGSKVGVVTS
jgi:hypothetical protein